MADFIGRLKKSLTSRRGKMLLAAGVGILLTGVVLGYGLGGGLSGGRTGPGGPGARGDSRGDTGDPGGGTGMEDIHRAQTPLPAVTMPETIIRYESFHRPCRLLFTGVEPAGRQLGGFTEEALAAEMEGWTVRQFTAEEVVLYRDTDDPCPEVGGLFTLGIHGGEVVLFDGEPEGGQVYARTGIHEGDLLPGDRELLRHGVIIEHKDDVWQYLEGIHIRDDL